MNCKKIINFGSSFEYGNKMEFIYENMLLIFVDIYGSIKVVVIIFVY